ncbi:MAG: DUF554 domain-containing protein [Bacillota bacterium]
MTGTVVNVAAICIGSILGLVIKRGIPERVSETVMQGLALAVILIGLQMAFQTRNPLIVIGSLALGGLVGAAIDIEGKLDRLGRWLESKVGGNGHGEIGRAFVAASLIFCVGAMAIMGSIEDGLTGEAKTLFAKSMLDGIASIIFASTMGIGVIFSAIPVLLYQGSITLAAGAVSPYLSPWVVAELTATGGLIIVGIGVTILNVNGFRVRVGNLLPAIFIAAAVTMVLENLKL